MSIEQTAEEFAESLNGFEEIAIRKQFGHEIDDLPGSMGGRAMVFTHLVRTGKPAEVMTSRAVMPGGGSAQSRRPSLSRV